MSEQRTRMVIVGLAGFVAGMVVVLALLAVAGVKPAWASEPAVERMGREEMGMGEQSAISGQASAEGEALMRVQGLASDGGSLPSREERAEAYRGNYGSEAARVKAMDAFLGAASPLWTFTRQMVKRAALEGIDWRLLPVLAMKESSGGRAACGGNPFGYGSCDPAWQFDNFGIAIAEVGRRLRQPPYAGLDLPGVFSMYQSGSAGPIDDPQREAARAAYVSDAMWLAAGLAERAGE